MTQEVFVFGSNLAGIHGAGSARAAYKHHGAIWGQGVGYHGNSYAIPTKGHELEILPLSTINHYVGDFLRFARDNPKMTFRVVSIGCGLAGFKPEDMAILFKSAPRNCILSEEFLEVLRNKGINRE